MLCITTAGGISRLNATRLALRQISSLSSPALRAPQSDVAVITRAAELEGPPLPPCCKSGVPFGLLLGALSCLPRPFSPAVAHSFLDGAALCMSRRRPLCVASPMSLGFGCGCVRYVVLLVGVSLSLSLAPRSGWPQTPNQTRAQYSWPNKISDSGLHAQLALPQRRLGRRRTARRMYSTLRYLSSFNDCEEDCTCPPHFGWLPLESDCT